MTPMPTSLSAATPCTARPANPRWRSLCCPLHAVWLLTGGMAADMAPAAPAAGAPSFTDGTPTGVTPWAHQGDAATRDLYTVAAPGQWVVVRGGTLLTMGPAGDLPGHDLWAQDGVIRAVQPTGAPLPEGALVVEAAGRWVIPGLSEMHTHPPLAQTAQMFAPIMGPDVRPEDLTLPYDLVMLMYLASGITRIQIMAGSVEELALREAVRSGRIRGPFMQVGSPLIDGNPPMHSPMLSWMVTDADGGRHAARQIAERGFDFAKPYTRLPGAAYEALVAECRTLGIRRDGHIPAEVPVEDALRYGQTGVAHVFECFYNEPAETREDLQVLARRARVAAGSGVSVCATLVAARSLEFVVGFDRNAYRAGDILEPMISYMMREESPFIRMMRGNPSVVAAGTQVLRDSIHMTQALLAEGVHVIPGTDFPPSSLRGKNSVHDELEVLVRDVGMSPVDALRAATLWSAQHHGDDANAGTLQPGRRSDLVVLDADPRADITATRRIDTVCIGAALLRKAALDKGIARVKALYAAMPVPA